MNPSNIKNLNEWMSYHIYTNFGHGFVFWMERNPLTSSFIAEYTNIFIGNTGMDQKLHILCWRTCNNWFGAHPLEAI